MTVMTLSGEILVSEEKIRERVGELAGRLNSDLKDEEIIILAVLNGAYIFSADITRRLTIKHTLGFVGIKSTDGDKTGKVRECKFFLDNGFEGKTVVVLDDIYDTGETLAFLKEKLREKGAGRVLSCLLCKKDHPRPQAGVKIDYLGFTLPDNWLVGYGMDYNGQFRALPYISYLI